MPWRPCGVTNTRSVSCDGVEYLFPQSIHWFSTITASTEVDAYSWRAACQVLPRWGVLDVGLYLPFCTPSSENCNAQILFMASTMSNIDIDGFSSFFLKKNHQVDSLFEALPLSAPMMIKFLCMLSLARLPQLSGSFLLTIATIDDSRQGGVVLNTSGQYGASTAQHTEHPYTLILHLRSNSTACILQAEFRLLQKGSGRVT